MPLRFYSWCSTRGAHGNLAQMISKLGWKYLDEGIEIFTVSDPTVYGEYGPYHYFSDMDKFLEEIEKL